jgi:hypothetical protein
LFKPRKREWAIVVCERIMPNHQIDKLSEPVRAFLIEHGYPPSKVDTWVRETRLYHDLGWRGDSLDEDLRAIFRHFNVDYSAFPESGACPPFGSLDEAIVLFFGWTRWGAKVKAKYSPLTFAMIEDAIARGRW